MRIFHYSIAVGDHDLMKRIRDAKKNVGVQWEIEPKLDVSMRFYNVSVRCTTELQVNGWIFVCGCIVERVFKS